MNEPTRITDSTESLIDVVITGDPSRCRNIRVMHNRCLSDHATILVDFDLKVPKTPKQIIYKRSLHNINDEQFEIDLNSIPWESILQAPSVDEMVTKFNEFILTLFDLHAPIRKITIKDKQKPWITDTIKYMMQLRDEALTRYNRD